MFFRKSFAKTRKLLSYLACFLVNVVKALLLRIVVKLIINFTFSLKIKQTLFQNSFQENFLKKAIIYFNLKTDS